MRQQKSQGYLEVQVLTASQDQLLLMLLDGAVRFVEGARERLAAGDRDGKNGQLLRAQTILLELIQSLSPAVGEKLYGNLIGLYKFIYRKLVEANLRDEARCLEEGLIILQEVRETWRQAVAAYRAGLAGGPPAPEPEKRLSVQA
ncbi:MAG: flagellar export chaperone FliS [Thermoanaerobaculia bacterium]